MRLLSLTLALTACSSSAVVVGDIDGLEFSAGTKAFHGTSDILIVDGLDCIDLAWVGDRYFDGINPSTGRTFLAVQIAQRAGEEQRTGVFGFGNDSPIKAFGLNADGDAFDVHVGREGSVEITDISERGIEGNFSISFTDSGVAGEFDAEFCVNMQ